MRCCSAARMRPLETSAGLCGVARVDGIWNREYDPGMTAPGPMPPYSYIDDFLGQADRSALLDWAIQQQPAFKPAKIFSGVGGRETRIDPGTRVALKLRGLGEFEPLMRERLLARLPEIVAAAGYRGAEPRSIEFELNAYG